MADVCCSWERQRSTTVEIAANNASSAPTMDSGAPGVAAGSVCDSCHRRAAQIRPPITGPPGGVNYRSGG